MAPSSAIFLTAISSRSMVDAPGTTWGAMASWTLRRAMPEIRIFSISCGVLIMIAIDTVVCFQSGFCCQAKTHEGGFDCSRHLFDGMVAVDLLEAALVA